ncbi:hypothetical protein BGZ94_007400 [Podila epigama]|nr:hypothetical protein BGZ94_007400 [Podila epigama]
MDIGPRHDIVFLNELHDHLQEVYSTLPQSNNNVPVSVSVGFFRVIGRQVILLGVVLVGYDIDRQMIRVQSCFHHEHIPRPKVTVTGKLGKTTASGVIDLVSSESESEEEGVDDDEDVDLPSRSLAPSVQGTESRGGEHGRHKEFSGVIDLTTDSETEGEVGDTDGEAEEEDEEEEEGSTTQSVQPRKLNHRNQTGQTTTSNRETSSPPMKANGNSHPRSYTVVQDATQTGARMVHLLVSTQLIDPRKYDMRALYEFSGELVSDPDLCRNFDDDDDDDDDDGEADDVEIYSQYLYVGSDDCKGTLLNRPSRKWVLLATSCRNMDGLDLYSYRQSILLIRKLAPPK